MSSAAVALQRKPTQVAYLSRPRCPHCKTVSRASSHGQSFEIVYCAAERRAFTDPYPSEETVHLLYDQEANDTNFERITGGFMDRLKDFRAAGEWRAIAGDRRVDRVLDFGTGNGRYAVAAAQVFEGSVVDAIDYQAEPPEYLRGRGPRIRYQRIDAWMQGTVRYDVILLRHVLEHNHQPDALIRALRDRLSRGGVLYVEVPNFDSWFTQKAGSRVNTWYAPFHLWHHSATSLRGLIEGNGLRCAIGYNDMPLIGTVIAMLLGRPKTKWFQLLGAALHPLQMALSACYGKTCVNARCEHR